MSLTGVVTSITEDWRGDTLAAAVVATDTVLQVGEACDFDEGASATTPGELVIGDETLSWEYVAVDMDANTVTLASEVGEAFEAGDPVVLWDPTVGASGSRVVEYVATVQMNNVEDGTAIGVIPHALIPTAGVDNLIGASVEIDQVGEDWHVVQVFGRKPQLDTAYIPLLTLNLVLPLPRSISNSTDTQVYGMVAIGTEWPRLPPRIDSEGWVTLSDAGVYYVLGTSAWETNNTGNRHTVLEQQVDGVTTLLRRVQSPASTGAETTVQAMVIRTFSAGTRIRLTVKQGSGGALDLLGASDGTKTGLDIARLSAV